MRQKKGVFSFDLKVCNDHADVTSAGRLFHAFAVATGKAWSRSCVSGTDSAMISSYVRKKVDWLKLCLSMYLENHLYRMRVRNQCLRVILYLTKFTLASLFLHICW